MIYSEMITHDAVYKQPVGGPTPHIPPQYNYFPLFASSPLFGLFLVSFSPLQPSTMSVPPHLAGLKLSNATPQASSHTLELCT